MGDPPTKTTSARLQKLEWTYKQDPRTRLFHALAEEYLRHGHHEESVEVCRKGLENFPGYVSARVTLARALIEIGQAEEAERELERVRRQAPDNLLATRLFGKLLLQRGEKEKAGALFDQLLALNPEDEETAQLKAALDAPPSGEPSPAAEETAGGVPPPAEASAAGGATAGPATAGEPVVSPPIGSTPRPADEADAAREAATEEPGAEAPAFAAPAVEEPAAEPPVAEEPTSEAPAVSAPAEEPYVVEEAVAGETADTAEPTTALSTDFKTATMAELYVEQGLLEKALAVYDELLEAGPENEGYAARRAELLALIEQGASAGETSPEMIPAETTSDIYTAGADAAEKKVQALNRWLEACRNTQGGLPEP